MNCIYLRMTLPLPPCLRPAQGYQDEFDRCRKWIDTNLRFDHNKKVSFFETTIRVLGGLLSAYDLSKDELFLEKATDIGTRLGKAFNTGSGMPNAEIHLRRWVEWLREYLLSLVHAPLCGGVELRTCYVVGLE